MKTLKSYYIDKSKKFTKSVIIWGEMKVQEKDDFGNNIPTHYVHSPLLYIRKPKWVTQEQFDTIISYIHLTIPQGTELK